MAKLKSNWKNSNSDREKLNNKGYNLTKYWPELSKKYSERFHRMWKYYLLLCAAGFRARYNQLWQVVLSKNGVRGGYQRIT